MEQNDIKSMSVCDLRRFLILQGITVYKSNKHDLVELAEASFDLGLMDNVDFHANEKDLSDRLNIKAYQLPDPFSIPDMT